MPQDDPFAEFAVKTPAQDPFAAFVVSRASASGKTEKKDAPVEKKFSESPRVKAEREAREYYLKNPLKENPNTPAWMNDPNRPMLPVDYANLWAKEGVVRAITGAKSFAEPAEGSGLTPSEVRAKRVQAGRDVLGGTLTAAAPVAAYPAAAALYAAPLTTLGYMLTGVGLGAAAQYGTKKASSALGATENESELLGELAGLGAAAIPMSRIGPSIRAAQEGRGWAKPAARMLDRILPSNQAKIRDIAKYAQTLKYQSDPGPKGLQQEIDALVARGNTKEAIDLINNTQQILGRGEPLSVAQTALQKNLVKNTLRSTLENAEQRLVTVEPRLRVVAEETQFPRIANEWDDLSAVLTDVAAKFKTANTDKTRAIATEAMRLASVFQRDGASGAELIRAKRLLDSFRKFSETGKIAIEGTQALDLKNASNSARAQLHTNKDIDAFLQEQEASLDVVNSMLNKLAMGPKDFMQDATGLGLLSAGSTGATVGALRALANNVQLPLARGLYRGVGGKTTPIPVLPPRPEAPVGLLGERAIPLGSISDPSGVVPNYEPFVSRVQPRLPSGGSTSNSKTKGIQYNAGDPDAIPQSPPRTGGANQPGGFGGIESPGGVMPPEQVPFTGSVPVGGRPSLGEPRVRTIPPVLEPDVIVTPVPNRVSPPANVLEGEVLQGNAPVAPPVRASNVETSVAKRERSARKLRTAKPTVEEAPPAKATVSKTAQATDTPAEAAKEIQSEVSRVIDVQGVTKAMEVKRRVLAALMEEMQPARDKFDEWKSLDSFAKSRKFESPSYNESVAITIPGDGTFRIPRTPEAITNLMKRITDASSKAWEGVGSVKATKPVAKQSRPTW